MKAVLEALDETLWSMHGFSEEAIIEHIFELRRLFRAYLEILGIWR